MICKHRIKKNNRRSFLNIKFPFILFFRKNKFFVIQKKLMFDSSAIYRFNDEDQYDINKLFGFSIGYHHKNSIRFGWRADIKSNKIEIHNIEYKSGERRPFIKIGSVGLNEWFVYSIICNTEMNIITYKIINCDGSIFFEETTKYDFNKKFYLGYYLSLYFGGNKKAPHDIIIWENC